MPGKPLSQKEIDSLLAEASAGGAYKEVEFVATKNVKPYDFKRPDKFSKDQMRTLHMLHESFARFLASSLSAYLRMSTTVNLVSVEQSTFEEYVQQIASPTILGVVSMDPLVGNVIFEVDSPLAFAIVDRLLGGSGKTIQKLRTITEIEQSLVNRVLSLGAEALKESWKNVVDVNPVLEESVVSSQFTRLALPSEVTVVISFEVRLQDMTGKLSICIPYSVLEPVVPNLSAPVWLTEWKNLDTGNRAVLTKEIGNVFVSLCAQLGSTDISVSDLLQLEQGDVIRLNSTVNQPLPLLVEDCFRYRAKPGLLGSKLGVRIISIDEKDAERD